MAFVAWIGLLGLPVHGQAARKVPGCAGLLPSRAGQGADGLETAEEPKLAHLGQSWSCKRLGLIAGFPRSESWTRSLAQESSKSADALRAESLLPRDAGSPGVVGLLWGGGPQKHLACKRRTCSRSFGGASTGTSAVQWVLSQFYSWWVLAKYLCSKPIPTLCVKCWMINGKYIACVCKAQ